MDEVDTPGLLRSALWSDGVAFFLFALHQKYTVGEQKPHPTPHT